MTMKPRQQRYRDCCGVHQEQIYITNRFPKLKKKPKMKVTCQVNVLQQGKRHAGIASGSLYY